MWTTNFSKETAEKPPNKDPPLTVYRPTSQVRLLFAVHSNGPSQGAIFWGILNEKLLVLAAASWEVDCWQFFSLEVYFEGLHRLLQPATASMPQSSDCWPLMFPKFVLRLSLVNKKGKGRFCFGHSTTSRSIRSGTAICHMHPQGGSI